MSAQAARRGVGADSLVDQRWQAVVERDRSADGSFVFAVATTGVYCRPSCAARQPRRHNVSFFATPDAAEAEGFRACQRCDPRGSRERAVAERMARLCEHIRAQAGGGEPLTLAALGREAGMSPSHLQRTFRAVVGVSPREYLEACRLEAFKDEVAAGASVTGAIYEAGFGSSSRLYERSGERLGMTPTEYRRGGAGLSISYAAIDTALGRLMLGATDRGVCFVHFGDSDAELEQALAAEYPRARRERVGEPLPEALGAWLDALRCHLEGGQPELDLPLDLQATAFQMRVWRALRAIPHGATRSYSEVAESIGAPGAARAVAAACAANRTALAIPCHRVLRASGELAGYRWGVERKRALLERETGEVVRAAGVG